MAKLPLVNRALAACILALLSAAAQAAVTVAIEMNPDPPRPGEAVRTQVTVANDGAAVASISLRATVPAGVSTFLTSSMNIAPTGCNLTGPTSACDAGDVMTFNLGALPAGGATTVSMVFTVAAATPAGSVITLPAEAVVSAVVVASATDSVTVDDDNALSLAVDEDVNGVASGATLTYTLVYGNRGIDAVTGTTLSLPMPAGATLVSATGGGSAAAGTVTWNLGAIGPGASGRQQAVVQLPGGLATGSVLQPAAATIAGTAILPESAQAEAVTIVGGGQLGLAVEMNPDPVRSGERARTEITFTNRTGTDLFTVTLRARVPEAVATFNPSAASMLGVGSVSNCNTTGATSSCDALDLLNVTVASLPAGAALTLTLPPVINAGTQNGRLLGWEVMATASGGVQSLASHTVPVDNDNALGLAVDEDLDAIAPGGELGYVLTWGNRSVDSVTDATLTFPVPVGTTVVDAAGGTVGGGVITWNLGTLIAGESGRRRVVVAAGAGLGGGTLLRVDAATLAGTGLGPESARGTAATNVRANPALALAMDAAADPVRSNERLRTTVTVTNRSAAQVNAVVLKLRVPDNLATFSPSSTNIAPTACNLTGATSACDAGDVAQFALGNIPAGASVVVLLPPLVGDGTDDGVLLTWEAVVGVGTTNVTARRTVPVANGNALTLGLDESLDVAGPGDNLTYSLTFGNRGIANVPGATLRLPLPAGATFLSATGGGTLSGNSVVWTIGDVPAGTAARRQATVALDAGLTDGTLLRVDAASLTGSGASAEAARATAATAIRTAPALGLGIEANPDPVRSGEQLRTELAFTNRTGATLFNVVLKARVPDQADTFSTSSTSGTPTACNLTGGTSACDAGDLAIWTLASLPAGAGVVYTVPAYVSAGTESGRVLAWEAIVTADGNHVATGTHHYAVINENALTLAIDDTPNSTPAGGVLTYVLTYGNRSVSPVNGAVLRFPVPEGTTLLSSTGGTLADGVVSFNLGTISAGQGGRRQLRVQLGAERPAGSLIWLRGPEITGTGALGGAEATRAAEVTPVEGAAALPGLLLTARLSPNPASPGTTITGTVTLSNNSGVDIPSGLAVRVRVPDYVATFSGAAPGLVLSQDTATGCQLVGSTSACDRGDKFTWTLSSGLANGAVATLTFTTTVLTGASGPVNGQLLALYADANDSVGRYASATSALLVGTFTDGDSDGIPNVYDNCLSAANPDQRDTNFDGFGNLCDADLNNNGAVNAADLALFRTAFGFSGTPLTNDADLNGSGGLVNAADLALFRTLFGRPPGPSALAP